MRIVLLALGDRQPAWIAAGYRDYARRLRGGWRLELKELPLERGSVPAALAREREGERLLGAVPVSAHVVALAVDGEPWTTTELAARLRRWAGAGKAAYVLLGGPHGLSQACERRAAERWSLSPLTLPHGLARVVAAEALYRAWSLNAGHPYHRA
jgi:23S rRNA (pseudouridine1915-N3)-methyltransferase